MLSVLSDISVQLQFEITREYISEKIDRKSKFAMNILVFSKVENCDKLKEVN